MSSLPRILIVEDNPVNLDVYDETLPDRFDARFAYNGEDALQIIRSFKPDVVLLDVMLPNMDGYEVCRRLRSDAMTMAVAVIMVSARVKPEDRRQGYVAGADDYITKPFSEEELLTKIATALRAKRSESAPSAATQETRNSATERQVPAKISFSRGTEADDCVMNISVSLNQVTGRRS